MNETPRDSDTRAALLRAARHLFAHHGFDGASVRAITDAAGANLGAITYHFGSKRALYGAVLQDCIAPLAARIESAARKPGAPLDRVEAVVRAYFAYMVATPELPRLVVQELAVGRDPAEEIGANIGPVLATLSALVAEGQADGSIRAGDPALLAMSIVAQPLHMIVAQKLILRLAGADLRDPATRERLISHAATFARNGLAAAGAEDPR